jgi:RNA polymerase sigma factor (sigma-70 family)
MKNCGSSAAWAEIYPDFSYQRLQREATEIARATRTEHLLEDLIQSGALGLVEARARYDPEQGVKFATFALRRVRGAMFDTFRKHLPRTRRAEERRRASTPEELTAVPRRFHEGYVLVDDLPSDILGVPSRTKPTTFADPESVLIAEADLDGVRQALATLAENEEVLLVAIYDFNECGDTGEALATRQGVCRGTISRHHRRVLKALRRGLGAAHG